jgi:hypothetical protein
MKITKIDCSDINLIISHNFLMKYNSEIDWDILSTRNDLFDYLNIFDVKRFGHKMNWKKISNRTGGKLPRFVIDCFFKQLDWNKISSSADLDEDTIIAYKRYVNWDEIFMYQTLSLEFMKKWKHKMSDECFLKYII